MHSRLVIGLVLLLATSGPAPAAVQPDDPTGLRNWSALPYYTPTPPADGGSDAPEIETLAIATAPLAFVGITPCRLADTRQAPVGEFGQPYMPSGSVRSFTITGQCSIPADAEAASFNFTVTNTGGPGFLLVYPPGGAVPLVSTLNYLASQTIANAAVVPLGPLGAGRGISTIPGVSGFDLIIDVNGYYTAQGVVSSLNGRAGAVSVTGGSNVTVTPSGQDVQVSAGPLGGGGERHAAIRDCSMPGSGRRSTGIRRTRNLSSDACRPRPPRVPRTGTVESGGGADLTVRHPGSGLDFLL